MPPEKFEIALGFVSVSAEETTAIVAADIVICILVGAVLYARSHA